jgi:hypothetical protein
MSIHDAIDAHVAAGRLFRLSPLLESAPEGRSMFAAPDVFRAVQPAQWQAAGDALRLGRFRADLDRFVEGGRVSVALQPRRKPATAYLARVEPVVPEVWDIRSTDPRPGIRALGRFAGRDIFVVLCWDYRENIAGPRDWNAFRERCLSEWMRLFPGRPAYTGASLDDYLSGQYFAV